jgi:hypothetical protein
MRSISLTKGQIALVDDEDFEYLNKFRWQAQYCIDTDSFYAKRGDYSTGKNITVRMSRYIMNTPKNMLCDHVNHNTLDNRKENLRNVTKSQNMINRRKQVGTKTGITGIGVANKKYYAHIRFNGDRVFGKNHSNIEDAIKDRKRLEVVYFGDYAYKGEV